MTQSCTAKLPSATSNTKNGKAKNRRAKFLKRFPSLKDMKNTLLRQGSEGSALPSTSNGINGTWRDVSHESHVNSNKRPRKQLSTSKTVVEVGMFAKANSSITSTSIE